MSDLLNMNKIWIEYISDSPSSDKYCIRYWEDLSWQVSYDDDTDNSLKNVGYIIQTNYKYGTKMDKMQTWTEPFGTCKGFFRWLESAKKFLANKFPKHKIDGSYNKEKKSFSIVFKIIKK